MLFSAVSAASDGSLVGGGFIKSTGDDAFGTMARRLNADATAPSKPPSMSNLGRSTIFNKIPASPAAQNSESAGAESPLKVMGLTKSSTMLIKKARAAKDRTEEANRREAESGVVTLHHPAVCVWPTGNIQGGRVDILAPSGVSQLVVMAGGTGGRMGWPSTLFAGTVDGSLLVYKWPPDEAAIKSAAAAEDTHNGSMLPETPPTPQILTMHNTSISSMALSPDGTYFITASMDGTIFVNRLKSKGGANVVLRGALEARQQESKVAVPAEDMILQESTKVDEYLQVSTLYSSPAPPPAVVTAPGEPT